MTPLRSLRMFMLALVACSCTLLGSARAHACDQPFPLSTKGRYIVDACGERFPLHAVNWFGASDTTEVVGGLDARPLSELVDTLASLGFNAVRLPFSNQMLHRTTPADAASLAANPELVGLTPLEVYDAVVEALTARGIAVILNNHTTISEWCCGYDYNGLWHHDADGAYSQSEDDWVRDWQELAARYAHIPGVVGADLRNEVRTERLGSSFLPEAPNWGSGNGNDWRRAAERAGNAVLDVSPELLVIVEGINWWGLIPALGGERPHLKPVRDQPIALYRPEKLVYAAHNYGFIGPRHNGDDGSSGGQQHYRDMDRDTLFRTLDEELGFVTTEAQPFTAPLWLSELGVGRRWASDLDRQWFANIVEYVISRDLDFAYWPFNPLRVDRTSVDDFGVLDSDWTPTTSDEDWRVPFLQRLLAPYGARGRVSGTLVRVASFSDGDESHSFALRSDWHVGATKGTCPDGARVVGLSRQTRGGSGTLRALCSNVGLGASWSPSREWTTAVDYESSSRPHVWWDWARGFTKYECPLDYYAAGASKRWWGSSGVLCERANRPLGRSCRTLWFDRHDERASGLGGDWAPGAYKGQCADDEHVAGLAQRNGEAAALLCCR